MNESQRKKRNFRASKIWKCFRHQKHVEQNGIDPITLKKLRKGCNLHHRNLSEEDYEDISHPEDFVMLNKATHDFCHEIYRYYKNDPGILDRIKEELDKWHE